MTLPFELPQFSSAKLIAFGVGALALIGFLAWINGMRAERNELREWQVVVVQAISAEIPAGSCKDKKGRPVDCVVTAKSAVRDIQWLGREYRTASQALKTQSEQLTIAKQKTEAAQISAREAAKRALDADKPRKAVRDGLTAPTRSGGLTTDEWSQL